MGLASRRWLVAILLAGIGGVVPPRDAARAQVTCPRELPVDEPTVAHWSFSDNLDDDSGHHSGGILQATCPSKPPAYDHGRFVSPPASLYFENVLYDPGLPATDPHVEIPNTPAWSSPRALTVEAWIWPARGLGDGLPRVILSRSLRNAFQYPFGMRLDESNHLVCYVNPAGTFLAVCTSSAAVAYDTWTYVAMTYDGQEVRAYVNGAPAGSAPAPGSIQNLYGDFTIGAAKHRAQVESSFKGYIDEVRVSSVVRSFAPCTVASPPTMPVSIVEDWEDGLDISRWLLWGPPAPSLRPDIGWQGGAGLVLQGADACGTGLWNVSPLRWTAGSAFAMRFCTNAGRAPLRWGGYVEMGLGTAWENAGICTCKSLRKQLSLQVDLVARKIDLRTTAGTLASLDYPGQQDSIWHQVVVTTPDSASVELWLDGENLATARLPQALQTPLHFYVAGYSTIGFDAIDDVAYGTRLIAPSQLVFAPATVGKSTSRRLVLHNPLGTPLVLGAISIAGGPFTVAPSFIDSLRSGLTIDPFGSVETSIWFDPLAPGIHRGLASVEGFGTGEPLAQVDLQGRARPLEMRWVTAQLYPERTIPASTSVIVQMQVPDSVGADSLVLHCAPGGQRPFVSARLELVSDDGVNSTYLGRTPAEMAGPRGLELHMTEHAGAARIGLGVPEIPLAFRVQVDNLAFPFETVPRTYRLISVPLVLPNNTIVGVLQDNLGNPEATRWRMFAYDGPSRSYAAVPGDSLASLQLGRGYWLVTRDAVRLDTRPTSGISTPTEGPFPVRLTPGWNLIGSPFGFPVAWSAISVDSAGVQHPTSGVVAPPLAWRPEIQGYADSVQLLEPFTGYWVDNLADHVVVLSVPPREAVETRSVGSTVASQEADIDSGWRMRIFAASEGVEDGCNEVGVDRTADAGWDAADRSEPPPSPGRWLSLYFPRPDGPEHRARWSADIRGESAVLDRARAGGGPAAGLPEGEAWSFDIAKNFPVGGSIDIVTLDFTGVRDVPADEAIFLADRQLERVIDLRQQSRYVFSLGARDYVSAPQDCRFVLVVGSQSFTNERVGGLQALPTRSCLQPSSPNPFNPMTAIRYDLARPGWIELRVHDARGQLVRELEGGVRAAGRYETYWDGRDGARRQVASGVYYCSLRAEGFQQTRRLVLVR